MEVQCRKLMYAWEGEYERECVLPDEHKGNHFDGISWFNDDCDFVDDSGL